MNKAISERDIVDFLSSGIIATDSHAIITHINRQSEKKLEIIARDLIGKNISEVLPVFHPVITECLQSGKPLMNQSIKIPQGQLVIHVNPVWRDQDIVGAVLNFQRTRYFRSICRGNLLHIRN